MAEVTPQQLADAAGILRAGGIVAFPTETVYGLGANALDAAAVAKIFTAKARPTFDPLIVHVAAVAAAWELVDPDWWEKPATAAARHARDTAQLLATSFWPGPLTLVLPKRSTIPGIVTAGLPTVGLRVPGHALARQLIAAAGVPVAAPSANPFGGISPTRASHVRVPCDALLDGGPCGTGLESTVVGFQDDGQPAVLRLGGISLEALTAVLGAEPITLGQSQIDASTPGVAPGMLTRHYSPRTALQLITGPTQLTAADVGGRRVGLLSLRGDVNRDLPLAHIELLAPRGELTQAAARLFEALHTLDAADLDLILAELVPEEGLGRAINDRLRRAAAQ